MTGHPPPPQQPHPGWKERGDDRVNIIGKQQLARTSHGEITKSNLPLVWIQLPAAQSRVLWTARDLAAAGLQPSRKIRNISHLNHNLLGCQDPSSPSRSIDRSKLKLLHNITTSGNNQSGYAGVVVRRCCLHSSLGSHLADDLCAAAKTFTTSQLIKYKYEAQICCVTKIFAICDPDMRNAVHTSEWTL